MSNYLTEKGYPSFYSFVVARYLGKDTPYGDFAYDLTYDTSWPSDNSYQSIYNHLSREGYYSNEPVLEIFKKLWKKYQKMVDFYSELHM